MKNERQNAILELVSSKEIQTQEALCDELLKKGFSVTQATVSRDIKELALIKAESPTGSTHYVVPQLEREAMGEDGSYVLTIISESVKDVDYALNTVVVKCNSGMAQAVCTKLDSTRLHNVVGTLAGDDTIFIIMRTEKDAERLVKELRIIIDKKV